jgi:hypothetical protein
MPLRETQSAVADWIRAPEGIAKALADASEPDFARAKLAALICSDETLEAIGRLEIYANAYFYRLLGVLSEDYEALRNLLGEALFNDVVTSYLLVEPSRHPSLRYAGARLPEFLASHAAAEGVRKRAPWAADLAGLEWARVDVFDIEDGQVLVREALASLAPEQFGSLTLAMAPWAVVRSFDHPVDALWKAGMRNEALSIEEDAIEADAEPVRLLIWRREERVRHRRLAGLESSALGLVREQTTFAELCEWAATQVEESEAPALAAGWLERWITDGLLRGLALTS